MLTPTSIANRPLTFPATPLASQAELISKLSQGCTLEAGGLIMTGSPLPVTTADGRPPFLKHGDEVRVWVEGCGQSCVRRCVVRVGGGLTLAAFGPVAQTPSSTRSSRRAPRSAGQSCSRPPAVRTQLPVSYCGRVLNLLSLSCEYLSACLSYVPRQPFSRSEHEPVYSRGISSKKVKQCLSKPPALAAGRSESRRSSPLSRPPTHTTAQRRRHRHRLDAPPTRHRRLPALAQTLHLLPPPAHCPLRQVCEKATAGDARAA